MISFREFLYVFFLDKLPKKYKFVKVLTPGIIFLNNIPAIDSIYCWEPPVCQPIVSMGFFLPAFAAG
jgi:hypothetical protein